MAPVFGLLHSNTLGGGSLYDSVDFIDKTISLRIPFSSTTFVSAGIIPAFVPEPRGELVFPPSPGLSLCRYHRLSPEELTHRAGSLGGNVLVPCRYPPRDTNEEYQKHNAYIAFRVTDDSLLSQLRDLPLTFRIPPL